jgi:hypothetical protein
VTADYPPEPWYLGGHLLVSAFRVPVAELPAPVLEAVPHDHAPLVVAGHVTLGAAFVHYLPGGALRYEELLLALPVRKGLAIRQSIPHIWVDSPASMRGGRELWGIPKALGTFTREVDGRAVRTAMQDDGTEVAALDARVGPRLLPGSPPVPLATAQLLAGRRFVSRNTVFARVHALRTQWRFAPDGPLGFLAGRTPLLSLALRDAAVVFGTRVERS